MAGVLRLKVATPEGLAVDEPVLSFTVRSDAGELCILPGHALILCSVAAGPMSYQAEGQALKTFAVDAGFLEAGPDHVHVISDNAVDAAAVDAEATVSEINFLESVLNQPDLDHASRAALAGKLSWAQARLSVAK